MEAFSLVVSNFFFVTVFYKRMTELYSFTAKKERILF